MPIDTEKVPIDTRKNADGVALNVASNRNSVAINVALNDGGVALISRLVALIRANSGIKRRQLAEELKVTTWTTDRRLASESGTIIRRGSKKTGGYYCKK